MVCRDFGVLVWVLDLWINIYNLDCILKKCLHSLIIKIILILTIKKNRMYENYGKNNKPNNMAMAIALLMI